MRREYVCTISSQAAPSPARHLRTSSAPSLTAKALTAPTVSSPGTCASDSSKCAALTRGVYDRRQSKVPGPNSIRKWSVRTAFHYESSALDSTRSCPHSFVVVGSRTDPTCCGLTRERLESQGLSQIHRVRGALPARSGAPLVVWPHSRLARSRSSFKYGRSASSDVSNRSHQSFVSRPSVSLGRTTQTTHTSAAQRSVRGDDHRLQRGLSYRPRRRSSQTRRLADARSARQSERGDRDDPYRAHLRHHGGDDVVCDQPALVSSARVARSLLRAHPCARLRSAGRPVHRYWFSDLVSQELGTVTRGAEAAICTLALLSRTARGSDHPFTRAVVGRLARAGERGRVGRDSGLDCGTLARRCQCEPAGAPSVSCRPWLFRHHFRAWLVDGWFGRADARRSGGRISCGDGRRAFVSRHS